MEHPTRLFDELTGHRATGADRALRDFAVRMANRYSRRSFLGRVSRASFAALGGSFLTLLLPQESAFANHCFSGPPDSCLCRNLPNPGVNRCRAGDRAEGLPPRSPGSRDPTRSSQRLYAWAETNDKTLQPRSSLWPLQIGPAERSSGSMGTSGPPSSFRLTEALS